MVYRRRAIYVVVVTLLAGACAAPAQPIRAQGPEAIPSMTFHVGVDDGDIRGNDHRVLQAAVDYVAGIGGGTVRVGPGRYAMRNALTLRENVRVVGVPGKTILAACDGFSCRLAAD